MYDMTNPERASAAVCIRRVTASCLTASLLAQSACFTYHSAAITTLRPGDTVHMMLTDEGRQRLEALLGGPTRSLTGQTQEVKADTAVVLIDELETMQGDLLQQRRGRVRIPLADVASVQVRTVDRRGTWTLVAVAAATFTAVIVAAIRRAGASGKASSVTGTGPPE
jgi:hypothetical protein